jgi:hypothetical protein
MSTPRGYSSQEKEDRLSAQFQTIEPVRELQFGSTVVAHQFLYEVNPNDVVEAGSTASTIVATAHDAIKGDVLIFYSQSKEVKVWSVTANSIVLAETLSFTPAPGDNFGVLRHKYPMVNSSGQLLTTATEVATASDGAAIPDPVKVVAGGDGTLVHVLKTDSDGELQIDVLSSALPSGAATEATLATLATEATVATLATESTLVTLGTEATALDTNGKVGNIETTLTALSAAVATEATLATLATEATVSTLATEATLSALNAKVTVVDTGNVTVVSSALPTGAATEATLATLATEATVSTLATEATLSALSAKVIEADTDNVTIVSSVLPTGAATEATLANVATSANQTNGSQKSQIVDGAGDIVDVVALNVALQATDKGLVTNTIIHGETTGGGGGYVDVKVTPSGAMVTEASISSIADVDGQKAMAASFPVVIASDQTAIPVTDNGSSLTVDGTVAVSAVAASTGRSVVNRARHVYSSTPVTTAAYQQLLASTGGTINEIEIFDSSGETLVLATGGIGSEVDQAFVFPGGNGRIPLAIGSGVRVSIKAVSATANAGEVAINFYS